MSVADTILQQLGGHKFVVMTGSSHFVSDKNTLRMKLAKNKSKANKLDITLDAYDTYKCVGFPSGPVCNPGLKAIQAALYPDGTNYMYFCHNTQTGEVFYAVTLNEHNVNLYKAGLR